MFKRFKREKEQCLLPHYIQTPEKPNLEKLYNENKEFFQELLVKEFTGFIPKDVNEPVLKFFSDSAQMIQKWVLWQSWYVNRKSIHDPLKLPRYEGMMVYLAVLHKMASVSTNIVYPDTPPSPEKEKEAPLVEKELEALKNFKQGFDELQNNKNSEAKATQNS